MKAIALVWPCCLAITALRIHQGATINIVTHLRGDEILAGACLGTLVFERKKGDGVSAVAWALLATLLAATSHPASGWLQYLRPYASTALLAVTLRLRPGRLSEALSSAALRYVATISYALYIVHPLTAQKGWWNQGSIAERYICSSGRSAWR